LRCAIRHNDFGQTLLASRLATPLKITFDALVGKRYNHPAKHSMRGMLRRARPTLTLIALPLLLVA
jgi:hypothetical protein